MEKRKQSLHATAILIYCSLLPPGRLPETTTECLEGVNSASFIVSPHTTGFTLSALINVNPRPDRVSIIFLSAGIVAAPFLLFRMKRSGYSACRVSVVPEGLHLTARR